MTPTQAAKEFKRCRPWLEAAIERAGGIYTIDDVAHMIGEGRMHFWPGHECAAVTEIAVYPRKRFLNVALAGGKLDELLGMIPSFQSWARHCACEKVTMAGRFGWERVLAVRGWKREVVVLSIPVEGIAKGETTQPKPPAAEQVKGVQEPAGNSNHNHNA